MIICLLLATTASAFSNAGPQPFQTGPQPVAPVRTGNHVVSE